MSFNELFWATACGLVGCCIAFMAIYLAYCAGRAGLFDKEE